MPGQGTQAESAFMHVVAHGADVLEDTWQIFEHVVARAPNLRAVVFECERNAFSAVAPAFRRLRAALDRAPSALARTGAP